MQVVATLRRSVRKLRSAWSASANGQRIRRYRAKIADLQEALEDILADLAESESEGWIHGIECERNALERTRKEIAEAETMLAIYL